MRTHVLRLAIVVTATAAFAAGCSKRVPPATPEPVRSVAEAAPRTPPAPPPPPAVRVEPVPSLNEDDLFARKTLADLNEERPLGDVFFGFDESSVNESGRVVLQRNAQWLDRWRSTTVTVEGHADARGTYEYNLALGDRRATAVKSYLASLGIPASRVLAVSKGEEAPFCFEEAESCWQQNRRGHFVVTGK